MRNTSKKSEVKQAKNGTYWTNEFWTEKHVISEDQYLNYVNWCYENIFQNNQQELTLKEFESEVELYNKKLEGESLFELLIYSGGEEFKIKRSELDEIFRGSITENNYSEAAIWFTAYQSHSYNYDLGEMGLYSFERGEDKTRNGGLFPVFSKIIQESAGQCIETNYGLFSGLIGIDNGWILLISLLNGNNKEISIKVAGSKKFCKTINNKIKNKPSENEE